MSPSLSPAELASLWEDVRDELRASLPRSSFRPWLEPLRAVSTQGETLYLSAPAGVRTWVERRYASRIAAVLRRHAPELTAVDFVEGASGAGPRTAGREGPSQSPTDPAHTFDRFVIGPGNRLAHAAALAVAELPGEAYNPLFLHGPPGLGKTHLLGAIRAYLSVNRPELDVHMTTAEAFTAEFVGGLRHAGTGAFKRRYRTLDVLLIDDVQVLEGKERTEEEFVHTFNALHDAGKQVVFGSDRPPQALARLDERLRDRLDWGLRVELEAPDLRTRTALLWRLAANSSLAELPDPGVLREIAARTPGNVRLLEGAMTRVLALASLLSTPLDDALVSRALVATGASRPTDDVIGVPRAPSVVAIQQAVCAALAISPADLLSNRRQPRVARARQLAMYLSRELTDLSLAAIAREFHRDHTTVLHAVRKISSSLEPGSELTRVIHRVRRDLGTEHAPRLPAADKLHGSHSGPLRPSTA